MDFTTASAVWSGITSSFFDRPTIACGSRGFEVSGGGGHSSSYSLDSSGRLTDPYNPSELRQADIMRALAQAQKPRKGTMKTIIDDIKAFVAEHRKIIYFVLILLIIDRFFLKRALENRIRAMAEKLLGTVENKLHDLTTAPAPTTPPAAPAHRP